MYLNFKLQIKIVESKWEFRSGTYLQGFENYTKFYNFPISSKVYILVPKFAHVMFTSSIVVKDELVITCGVCLIPKIIYYLLGFHVATHYQRWSIDTKKELIWWKLSSIWMKILNDIECNVQIELKRNRMQIGAKVLKIYSWQWCWKNKTLKWHTLPEGQFFIK
jgi:hypothetical protein